MLTFCDWIMVVMSAGVYGLTRLQELSENHIRARIINFGFANFRDKPLNAAFSDHLCNHVISNTNRFTIQLN